MASRCLMTLIVIQSYTTLTAGDQIDVEFPLAANDRVPDLLRQLKDGSLARHALPTVKEKAPKSGPDCELIAAHGCTCFGADAKGGDVVVKLTIKGRQSREQKKAIATDLLAGTLADKVRDKNAIEAEAAAADGDNLSAADKLAAVEAELADTQVQLATAMGERDALKVRLAELEGDGEGDPGADDENPPALGDPTQDF